VNNVNGENLNSTKSGKENFGRFPKPREKRNEVEYSMEMLENSSTVHEYMYM